MTHLNKYFFLLMAPFIQATELPKSSLKSNGELTYNLQQKNVDTLSQLLSKGTFYGRLRNNNFLLSSHDANGDYSTPVAAFGATLLYKSASYRGFDFNLGLYATQSIFNKNDFTQYVSKQKSKDTLSRANYTNTGATSMLVLGGLNLSYTFSKTTLRVGRQLVETFYTRSNDTKMIPNTFDGLVLSSKNISNTKIQFAYLYKQKLRDHTSAHAILMYGDANSSNAQKPQWSENDDSAMHKGLTYTALKANAKPTDAPLIVLDLKNHTLKKTNLSFAAYSVPNLLSQIMLEAKYKMNFQDVSLHPAVRYIQQFDNGAGKVGGASLLGNSTAINPHGYNNPDSLNAKMLAAKLIVKYSDIKINLAYTNILNEADLVTPWRGFPTSEYTRSMGIYNWRANTKSYRIQVKKSHSIALSLLYLDEDFDKGSSDSFYYYAGYAQHSHTYPNFYYKLRLGYRAYLADIYDKQNYLDSRLEFNYLF